jgi:hypothetical protein
MFQLEIKLCCLLTAFSQVVFRAKVRQSQIPNNCGNFEFISKTGDHGLIEGRVES